MTPSVEIPLTKNFPADGSAAGLTSYEAAGGYQALRKALGGMEPKQVTQMVKEANLRGRGGAGFPTASKWGFVPLGPDVPNPTYLVCNAD